MLLAAIDPQISSALVSVAVTIIGLLGTAAAVLGGWGLLLLRKKLGMDKDAASTARFEAIAANGISKAAKIVGDRIAAGDIIKDPHAAVVAEALVYAAPKAPPEMKQLNMAPDSLEDRLDARVAAVLPRTAPDADAHTVTEALNSAQLRQAPIAAKPS